MPEQVLEGVRVLELGVLLAAPYAGMLLRDFGASVVKVEMPAGGDASRAWRPAAPNGMGLLFARVNAGKKSVGVDLRLPEGQDLVRRLAASADIVIENFRPGRVAGWGIGWEDLHRINPRLVMVHISGYGQAGPYREQPGFGAVAEAVGGMSYLAAGADGKPTIAPFGLGDTIAAMAAANGALLGLLDARKTGIGTEIDIALYEPTLAMLGESILEYSINGTVRQANDVVIVPRGTYKTKDGKWIIIAGSTNSIVGRLFAAMGQAELFHDERYSTNAGRLAHRDYVEGLVVDWVASLTREDAMAVLRAHHVAAGPANDPEDLATDPHFHERGSVRTVDSDMFGHNLTWPGTMLSVPGRPPAEYRDPPLLGEHTHEVLSGVGLSPDELSALRQSGAIQ